MPSICGSRGRGKGELVALSDSNPDWWGTFSLGVEIVPPTRLKEMALDKIIVSNIYHAEQIIETLTGEMGFRRKWSTL